MCSNAKQGLPRVESVSRCAQGEMLLCSRRYALFSTSSLLLTHANDRQNKKRVMAQSFHVANQKLAIKLAANMFCNQSRAIPESKGEGGLHHGHISATLFQVQHRETKNHPHVLLVIILHRLSPYL